MQQQPSCSTTLADRSISVGLCAPPAKEQLAGILNHDDLAPSNTIRRAPSRMARHFSDTYPFVTQKARELNFPRSAPRKPSNTRARPSNQRLVQRRPPFSRRRSPNRPSPVSSGIDRPPQHRPGKRISLRWPLQQRCVHSIASDRAFLPLSPYGSYPRDLAS